MHMKEVRMADRLVEVSLQQTLLHNLARTSYVHSPYHRNIFVWASFVSRMF